MVTTMGLSNTSLEYINYPTQILFKSSKLIPVMMGGIIILRKSYSTFEYFSAFLLTVGLAVLTFGNTYAREISINFTGIAIIITALFADAFIGNIQEGTMVQFNVSSKEMALYSHSFGSIQLFLVLIMVGQLKPAFLFCWNNPISYFYMVLFSISGYSGAMFVLTMIKIFGAFATTTATSCRKFSTLILSFIFFPKPFSIYYFISILLVFIGISLQIYSKNYKKNFTIQQNQESKNNFVILK